MTMDALRDAFMAGWSKRGENGADRYGAEAAFSDWYSNALATLDRAPATDDDGWIPWDGSADIPPGLTIDDHVEVRFKSGTIDCARVGLWYWKHNIVEDAGISAYRVVTP